MAVVCARTFVSACNVVTGTGIPDSLVNDVFALNKALFRLPLEEKVKLKTDENHRGWTPFQEVRVMMVSGIIPRCWICELSIAHRSVIQDVSDSNCRGKAPALPLTTYS